MANLLTWPSEQLGEALIALAHHTRLKSRRAPELDLPATPTKVIENPEELGQWLTMATEHLGLEAEPAQVRYGEIAAWLRIAAPALLKLPNGRFILLLGRGHRNLTVIRPDLKVEPIPLISLHQMLCQELEAPFVQQINRLLDQARIPANRRGRAQKAMLHERLSNRWIDGLWQLRLSPGSSFIRQIWYGKMISTLGVAVTLHIGMYLAYVGSWWIAGQGALAGNITLTWWIWWAVLLMGMVPLRIIRSYLIGLLSIRTGELLKKRLLFGALRLDPDEIRHQGIGQLLGRVHESEALEAIVLFNGLYGLLAIVELGMGFFILARGAGGLFHALIMVAWVAIIAGVSILYYHRRRDWTDTRRTMTHDLIERLVGYRTRLAQELPERRHQEEDLLLEHYLNVSRASDKVQMMLTVLLQRGWLIIGLLGLAPAFISGGASIEGIAVGLGGVIFIAQTLDWRFIPSFLGLIDAAVVWQQVAPLFHAASRPKVSGAPTLMFPASAPATEHPILVAHNLTFRYPEQSVPALRGANLRIHAQDRILLEGPSGGGKTTLTRLLVGLDQPETGLLLLNGLDHNTLGAQQWRQRVAAAPQFHENHVLSETFLFNLLMGRRWPPTQADIKEAETICAELGLGDLLSRMPSGMLQWVGDTGWQLSHGERSRLYIARALLQNAEIVILDESFAALDPENLRQAIECVLRRTKTLLVIAHP